MATDNVKAKDVGEAGGIAGGESKPVELDAKGIALGALDAAKAEIDQGRLAPDKAAARVAEMIEKHAPAGDPFEGRWQGITLGMLTSPPPPVRWLLRVKDPDTNGKTSKGVLPYGKVAMLTAGGGVGKTTVLTQFAISVATGRDWLGAYQVAEPGSVLLALGEDSATDTHRRLYYAAHAMNLAPAQLELLQKRLVILPLEGVPAALTESDGRGNVSTTPVLEQLQKRLATPPDGGGWSLLILDPLSRWAGAGPETDNTSATRFIQAVETLKKVAGDPAVMLSHHVNQASKQSGNLESDAARGVTALVDGVRLLLTMASPGAKSGETPEQAHKRKRFVTITGAKTNVGTHPPPVDLVRDDEGILGSPSAEDKAELKMLRDKPPVGNGKAPKEANAAQEAAEADTSDTRPGVSVIDALRAPR